MADHASDLIVNRDLDPATGELRFLLLDQRHAAFAPAQRDALRTAALQGWTQLRAAWIGIHGAKAEAYLDSLTTAQRDGWVRQLKIAEMVEPPG